MTIRYFGYGAMSNPSIIRALLGRTPVEQGSYGNIPTLKDWSLVVQNLNDIPNITRTHAGVEINPQALLREVWGDDFRSYTIIENPGGHVYGAIWDGLSESERELIREWELIHWGWFQEIACVNIRSLGIYQCCTEAIGDEQSYDTTTGFVIERDPPLLLPEKDIITHAIKVRTEYSTR